MIRTFTLQEILEVLDIVRWQGVKGDWPSIKDSVETELKRIVEIEIKENILKETQMLIDSRDLVVKDIEKIIDDIENEAD